ncbi:MAG TPA: CRISPR-associated endonuclease Cas1 [Roseiflexaceae bacterium]|nr:CRISPR-associated endonuclease Cas1 [Roseiflexaceae bacterium]
MATLYVQEQGAKVHKRDNQVLITKNGATLDEVPLARVDQVVLMGLGVQISTAALVDFLTRDIPVLITNQHGSRLYVALSRGVSRFGELRTQQMHLVHTPALALELAREMIRAKLTNQRTLLASTAWPAASSAARLIEQQLANLARATTIDMVRGYEGVAAAAYFGAWRAALPKAWGFQGRAFYPPPDPVNALLSFGYTLALNDVLAAVQITGLDPYLGTFHVPEPGRPSLALDLLEEFRPLIVDRLVLELLRTNAITRAQFERPAQKPDAVYLDTAGRALFVDRYQALMLSPAPLPSGEQTTLRRVVLLQAQTVARVVRGEQERYTGYTPA